MTDKPTIVRLPYNIWELVDRELKKLKQESK